MQRGQSQALFSGALCQDQKKWAQTETEKIPLSVREHFFTVRVTEHWHRLLREAVESSLLEILKSHLDTVQGNRL